MFLFSVSAHRSATPRSPSDARLVRWIYFLSDRVFQSLVGSPWGARQPEPFFDKTRKIYSISLKKDGRFPFLPTDELVAAQTEEKDKEKEKDKKKDADDQSP